MRWILLLLGAVAVGCASTSARRISKEPPRFAIECKGQMSRCHERAAKICYLGYDVVDRADHHGAVAFGQSSGYASGGASSGYSSAQAVPTYRGELVVECRRSK